MKEEEEEEEEEKKIESSIIEERSRSKIFYVVWQWFDAPVLCYFALAKLPC